MSRNTHELMSKAQVMREYGFPEHQLEDDLLSGAIAYFTSTGKRVKPHMYFTGRFYIPRYAVERRIEELASAPDKGS